MQINEIRTIRALFEARDIGDSSEDNFEVETHIEAKAVHENNDIHLELKAYNTDNSAPYYFEVILLCTSTIEDKEDQYAEQLCKVNLPAIAFPYLREQVADLVRRGGFPPMHIPSVNFAQVAREQEQSHSASADE